MFYFHKNLRVPNVLLKLTFGLLNEERSAIDIAVKLLSEPKGDGASVWFGPLYMTAGNDPIVGHAAFVSQVSFLPIVTYSHGKRRLIHGTTFFLRR